MLSAVVDHIRTHDPLLLFTVANDVIYIFPPSGSLISVAYNKNGILRIIHTEHTTLFRVNEAHSYKIELSNPNSLNELQTIIDNACC